jgi:hypothetical protein
MGVAAVRIVRLSTALKSLALWVTSGTFTVLPRPQSMHPQRRLAGLSYRSRS